MLGFAEQDTVDTSEGEPEVVVRVRRTGGDSGSVGVAFQTIPYDSPDYAAVPGQDFDEVSDRLAWDDGDTTSREIRVPIRTDGIAEGHEYFRVRLSDVTGGAGLGTRNATVHIDSDGAPSGRFHFSFTESTVIEGDSVQLTVYRDDYVNGEVSVTLTPIAGTAPATEDFDPDPITLVWDDGNHGAQTVAIAIVDDSVQEGPESFTVELSNPSGGAVIGEPSRITIAIEGSDQGPPPPPPPSPPPPPPPPPPPRPGPSGGGGGVGFLSLLLLGIASTVLRAGRAASRRASRWPRRWNRAIQ